MKRFIIASCLLSAALGAHACIAERPTYNYYLMSVEPTDQQVESQQQKAIDAFWNKYTGGRVTSYVNGWDKVTNTEGSVAILRIARQKKDTEMVAYLTWLNRYLKISRELGETWEYPTRQQLAQRRQALTRMLATAKAYRGRRLKAQYRLLAMRANMLLGNDQQNKTYWKTVASKLPQSVYRDMMENIYARALLKGGNMGQALEIYARQGDQQSMRWCVRNYRNLNGIKAIYAKNANSLVLPYLVQDFVNNVQETQDVYTRPSLFTSDADKAAWTTKDYTAAINEVGARAIYKDEAQAFIAFAKQVASDGKTASPALWQTATGALQFLLGDYANAKTTLAEAQASKGTQLMHDNARAIADINSIYAEKMDAKEQARLVASMRWLRTMTMSQQAWSDDGSFSYALNPYYGNMLQRMVYNHLVPQLRKEGEGYLAIALLGMMDNHANAGTSPTLRKHTPEYNKDVKGYDDMEDWTGDYFDALQQLSVDSLKQYVAYLQAPHADSQLAEQACNDSYRNAEYYADLIATRLMAQGRFDEAIPYLKQVSPDFLTNSNVCGYMGRRDYREPRWFTHQVVGDTLATGPRSVTLTTNQKLLFCQDVTDLQHRYQNAANDTLRARLGYDLATRLYQASYEGDCWYLTHYAWSCMDTVKTGERDLIQDAIDLLGESALHGTKDLQFKSLYALAFIRRGNMVEGYPYVYPGQQLTLRKESRQYQAMAKLNTFLTLNPAYAQDKYVSHCDYLRLFRKVKE